MKPIVNCERDTKKKTSLRLYSVPSNFFFRLDWNDFVEHWIQLAIVWYPMGISVFICSSILVLCFICVFCFLFVFYSGLGIVPFHFFCCCSFSFFTRWSSLQSSPLFFIYLCAFYLWSPKICELWQSVTICVWVCLSICRSSEAEPESKSKFESEYRTYWTVCHKCALTQILKIREKEVKELSIDISIDVLRYGLMKWVY